jgi:hypothetical protein
MSKFGKLLAIGLFGGGVVADTTAPTVTITCTQTSPSATTPLNFTFTFSETVTGFTLGDITVGNGTAGNFAGSGTTYTADITPTGMSVITVDVAGSVCQDAAGNNNSAATQFSFTSTAPFSDTFTRGDGAIGSIWTGATWTIAGNAALNTPTVGSEAIPNGTFDADANWTKGAGWTIGSGVASRAPAGDSSYIYQDPLGTEGLWYQIQVEISSYAAGILKYFLGGSAPANVTIGSANGAYSLTNRMIGSPKIYFQASTAGTNLNIDNVSAKPITLSTLFATLPSVGVASVTAQAIVAVDHALTQAGLVVNLDSISSPANFVIANLDGANAKLTKCVAGVYTNVITGAITFGATKNLKVIKSGDDYSLYYGTPGIEAQVGTTQTITGMNGTIHGLFSTYPTPKLDTYQLSATP